jgi:hypothetical protein
VSDEGEASHRLAPGGTIMIDLTITLTLDEAKVLLHSAQRDFTEYREQPYAGPSRYAHRTGGEVPGHD